MVYPGPESCNTVCPRPDSRDTQRALMSVTPNLCCDETEPRSIHSPDITIDIWGQQFIVGSELSFAL